jgi:SNF2 family DNA or RNA helicase
MLISKDHQALIFADLTPAQVLPYIATAKVLPYEGRELVVVPHGIDETRVLRNMGLEVPSPIGFYYDWPRLRGIHDPFHHQRETAGFTTLFKRCYVLNDIGTGKTASTLWGADYLMSQGKIRKALILSPLSTLERVWADSIFETFPHRKFNVLHGKADRRRQKFADDSCDFYIINHDGLEIVCDVQRHPKKKTVLSSRFLRDDIDLVIIDELAVYRNAQTDRYKVLKKALLPKQWIWGLTGAPIPEAPTDAWAECRLITPETVPDFFTQFRNMTMQQVTQHRWVPRAEATEVVYKAMQPAVRFTRDQCLDLPELTTSERGCELSAEQQKHYKEIMQELFTEVQGKGIKAVNEGVKRIKLLQVVCGVLYAEQFDEMGVKMKGRATLEIDCKSRIAALREVIEAAAQKVIVFAPFSAVLDMLYRELQKDWSCALVYGDTPKGQRDKIFADFQQKPDPHVLIADAGTMSHGLTLTEASTCVWYAPIDSNEDYTQANGRITRQGQIHTQNVIHLSATAVERRIYKRLENKQKVEGALMEMVEAGMM